MADRLIGSSRDRQQQREGESERKERERERGKREKGGRVPLRCVLLLASLSRSHL